MTRSTLCAGLIAAALSIAPAAQASIPGPDGVIHGCYAGGAGTLRALSVIDSAATCPVGLNPLLWNVTGPVGPTGPGGPAGPPGDPATGTLPETIQYHMVGTSLIYVARDGSGGGTSLDPTIRTRIIPLPLGNWAVTVHLEIMDRTSCSLYGAGSGTTKTQDQMNGLTDGNIEDPNNLTLTTTVAETSGNELTLKCYSFNDHSLYVQLGSLVAIRVANVDDLPFPVTKKPGAGPSDTANQPTPIPLPHPLSITRRQHARLVDTYYSPRASSRARQTAQIALLAEQGVAAGDIARQTFSTDALVRSVIARYR